MECRRTRRGGAGGLPVLVRWKDVDARSFGWFTRTLVPQLEGVYREPSSVAGLVPRWLTLPGRALGVQREVRIHPERVRHIRARHHRWAAFCLEHMSEVLENPEYVGQTQRDDLRRVEFVRTVGRRARLLLVSVKFLDEQAEAWVNSAYPIDEKVLTRRLRSGTLGEVRRGP